MEVRAANNEKNSARLPMYQVQCRSALCRSSRWRNNCIAALHHMRVSAGEYKLHTARRSCREVECEKSVKS